MKCPGCGKKFSKLRKCDECGCCVDCFYNLDLPDGEPRLARTPAGECYCAMTSAVTARPEAP